MDVKWFLRNLCTSDEHEICTKSFRVGRSTNLEIACLSTLVSRVHAEFIIRFDNLYVKDLGSSNGTYINNDKIQENLLYSVKDGDTVGLGYGAHDLGDCDQTHYVYTIIKRTVAEHLNHNAVDIEIPVFNAGIEDNGNAVGDINDVHKERVIKMEVDEDSILENKDIKTECDLINCIDNQHAPEIKEEKYEEVIFVKSENTEDKVPERTNESREYSNEDDIIVIDDDLSSVFCHQQIKKELAALDAIDCSMPIIISDDESEYDGFDTEDLLAQLCDDSSENERSCVVKNTDTGDLCNFPILKPNEVIKSGISCTHDSAILKTNDTTESKRLCEVTKTAPNDSHNIPIASTKDNTENKTSHNLKKIDPSDLNNLPILKTDCLKGPISIVPAHHCHAKEKRKSNTQKINKVSNKKKSQNSKRKSEERKDPIETKRFKTANNLSNVRTDKKSIQKQLQKRKKSAGVVDNKIKEEQDKIKELRRIKLKEIEVNNVNKKRIEKEKQVKTSGIANTDFKTKKTHVKVSDSRGSFLLDKKDIESTSLNNRAEKCNPIALVPEPCSSKTSVDNTNIFKIPKINSSVINHNNVLRSLEKVSPSYNSECQSLDMRRHNSNTHNNKVIEKLPIFSLDIILNIINWKTSWLQEQTEISTPPPVNKRSAVKMCYSFSSHNDYCNIVNPLLMLELWDSVFKEWCNAADETRQKMKRFSSSIVNVIPHSKYFILQCSLYISKNQKQERTHVKEHDLVIINVPLTMNNKHTVKRVFGFVVSCSKSPLRANDLIDAYLAEQFSDIADSSLTIDIMIRRIPEAIYNKKYIEGGIVLSMVPQLREFDAVRALGTSSLCKFIIDPVVEDYLVPLAIEQKFKFKKDELAPTQKQVICEALNICMRNIPGIYLIQGPPGTGKTKVICNIVQELIFTSAAKDVCVLMVAPSNAAVDELVVKINSLKAHMKDHEKKRIKLLRIGPKQVIRKEVAPYSLDALIKLHVDKKFFFENPEVHKDYHSLVKEKGQLEAQIANERVSGNKVTHLEKKLLEIVFNYKNFAKNYWKQKYYEECRSSRRAVLEGANVICTTLSSCIKLNELKNFGKAISCCIVDEATQSREAETLIPLILGIKKLILVGDPQQLPAVTVSPHAKDLGHGQSLFARIKHHFENKLNNPIRMLNVQYRMHPEISLFPNINFYNGELQNSPTYTHKQILHKLMPYCVFNLDSLYTKNKNYANNDEVECILKLLEAITNIVDENSTYTIGIITPYNSQKEAINLKLTSLRYSKGLSISVNTVDSFQGLEKDIIILSCVRYSPNSFLSDVHRLNVAITRAKHALYIVGTSRLFKNCPTLGRIKQDAQKRMLFINITCTINSSVLEALISSPK